MDMEYLQAIYDTRKSFYNKAMVETIKNTHELTQDLYSYGVLVASIVWTFEKGTRIYKYFGKYSQTTTRHQKEFFKQYGLTDNEIKKLFKEGTLEV